MQYTNFYELVSAIYKEFDKECNSSDQLELTTRNLKEALQGRKEAENYFLDYVDKYLYKKKLADTDIEYPSYYESLVDGIYQENWGLAGMSEWFTPPYERSSSAKIIGDRIYFMKNGRLNLMPQRIDEERRKKLVAKLLSIKPDERKDKDVNEIYLIDGTRVTIFNESVSKKNREDQYLDSVVFRRYIVPEYTFEEQAKNHTIPVEAIALFKTMVKLGYNIAITGAVRTAKSTFLATWQSYEDTTLEGVLLETDPEIPIHELMPTAPIMQIVTNDDNLQKILKHILRSDADYIIMGEGRDGISVDTFLRVANKGTRRCKITFHNRFPQNLPYDMATEIIRTEGGTIAHTAEKVAQSIDYIFHFIQLQDKSQKRLDGMYELSVDYENGNITVAQICKYQANTDTWVWNQEYHIASSHRKSGIKENAEMFALFEKQLADLGKQFPMDDKEWQQAHAMLNYR
ncbi:Flp pilus assembly complex ATPase component [Aminipila butyrica]|uniref:Flp pilus assembly complex ATPase component n=1 Tax=Aminipila butyrica TaxID=433296 RepID=A0A858BXF8_9FIRM|nr:ATPase, T2SS/T4P/T4SS family [Aminipila butyrica]QIB69798.1 Flp pilus assembly complex ATPase component [Aminipila butyrica]